MKEYLTFPQLTSINKSNLATNSYHIQPSSSPSSVNGKELIPYISMDDQNVKGNQEKGEDEIRSSMESLCQQLNLQFKGNFESEGSCGGQSWLENEQEEVIAVKNNIKNQAKKIQQKQIARFSQLQLDTQYQQDSLQESNEEDQNEEYLDNRLSFFGESSKQNQSNNLLPAAGDGCNKKGQISEKDDPYKDHKKTQLCLTAASESTNNLKKKSTKMVASWHFQQRNYPMIKNKHLLDSKKIDDISYKELFRKEIKRNQKLKTELNETKAENERLRTFISTCDEKKKSHQKKKSKETKKNASSKTPQYKSPSFSKERKLNFQQYDLCKSDILKLQKQLKAISKSVAKINASFYKLQSMNIVNQPSKAGKLKKMVRLKTQNKECI